MGLVWYEILGCARALLYNGAMANPHPIEAPPLTTNPLARLAGRDAPLHALLPGAAAALAERGIRVRVPAADPLEDYAQIDPGLARMPPAELVSRIFPSSEWPANGLGYAGFGAEARSRFLLWLEAPHQIAPPSFQTLFLAQVESTLVDAAASGNRATLEMALAALRTLEAWPHWRNNEQAARTLLFAHLLLGDGTRIASWLAEGAPAPSIASVAVAQQALLGGSADAR